jgi:hypothetical protein
MFIVYLRTKFHTARWNRSEFTVIKPTVNDNFRMVAVLSYIPQKIYLVEDLKFVITSNNSHYFSVITELH